MPPTFTYTAPESRYVGTLANLLARSGDPQAQAAVDAARASGQADIARGNAWAGAAHDIAAIPGQIAQAKNEGLKTSLLQGQVRQQQIAGQAQQRQQAGVALLQTLLPKFTSQGEDGKPVIDHKGLAAALEAGNAPDAAETWLKHASDSASSLATIDAADKAPKIARALAIADAANKATDAGDFKARLGQFAVAGRLDPAIAQQVGALADQAGPDGWAALKKQYVETGDSLAPHLTIKKDEKVLTGISNTPIIDNTDPSEGAYTINGQRFDKTGKPIGTQVPKQAEPPKLGSPEDFIGSYAKEKFNIAPTAMSVAQKAEALSAYKSANADQDLRDAALAQKNIAQALAQMQLNQMPTKEQAASVADDLVHHRISPDQLTSLFSTRGKEGLSFKLAVTSEAKKLDPQFNFEEAQSNYNLSKSTGFQNTVRYMDSTLESMPRLLENVSKLGRGNFRTWNEVANAAAGQFNSTDLKRVKTDALLVGDEVAKILSGGGTGSATSDAKLKQGTELLNVSDSVPAIAATLDEIQNLIGNRRRALTRGTYMEKLNEPSAQQAGPKEGDTRTVGSDNLVWKTVNGKTGWYK